MVRPDRTSADVRYRRAPDRVWRWCTGEVLVRGIEGDHHELAGAAAAVWAVLDRPSTITEVAGAIGTGPGAIGSALAPLLGAGLVVTSTTPPAAPSSPEVDGR